MKYCALPLIAIIPVFRKIGPNLFQVAFIMTLTVNYQKIVTSKELTEYRNAVEVDFEDTMALSTATTQNAALSRSAFSGYQSAYSSKYWQCWILSWQTSVAYFFCEPKGVSGFCSRRHVSQETVIVLYIPLHVCWLSGCQRDQNLIRVVQTIFTMCIV